MIFFQVSIGRANSLLIQFLGKYAFEFSMVHLKTQLYSSTSIDLSLYLNVLDNVEYLALFITIYVFFVDLISV